MNLILILLCFIIVILIVWWNNRSEIESFQSRRKPRFFKSHSVDFNTHLSPFNGLYQRKMQMPKFYTKINVRQPRMMNPKQKIVIPLWNLRDIYPLQHRKEMLF